MQTLSKDDINNLKICGKILSESLNETVSLVKPGISAEYLNNFAEKQLRNSGARPSFLNYGSHGGKPFPASLCVSINDEIVHGIPLKDKIIRQGDIVGLDLGAEYKGVCTDMAITVIAGRSKNEQDVKLLNITKESLYLAIKQAVAGKNTGDIGYEIQNYVESKGFNVVRALVGHGIGKEPHMDPQIPNFGFKGQGEELIENTAIAIEPMVTAGSYDVKTKKDGWTVVLADGKKGAHFEHTVLITGSKPLIVTR